MSLIAWNDRLSVGIPSTDKQHKVLVGLVNELHDAMTAGRSREVVAPVLAKLIQYTKEHFAHEEHCMNKTCFAHTNEHACQHADLAVTVLKFEEEFKAGKVGLSMEVLTFLTQWLNGHIMGSDHKYAQHLISHHIT